MKSSNKFLLQVIMICFFISYAKIDFSIPSITYSGDNNLPDSLFLKTNVDFIRIRDIPFDKENAEFKLKELNSEQRKMFTNKIKTLRNYKSLYKAYFYSKQNVYKSIKPIILFIHLDSWVSIYLITLNSEFEVLDYLEVAGGNCSGPFTDRQSGKTYWCDEKEAYVINDSSIVVSIQKSFTEIIDDGEPDEKDYRVVDSLALQYKLSIQGKLNLVEVDSTRMIKRLY